MKNPGSSISRYGKRSRSVALVLIFLAGWSYQANAQSQHELLFFTSVDALEVVSETSPVTQDSFVRPAVDILYSYSAEKFRFLAEYLWSSDEAELERMKAGWKVSDHTMLWFGRFHSTANFWASEYHHGQYLQTSITRPNVDQWEDDAGPLPSHITGLSLEHESVRADDSAIGQEFSLGLAPLFVGQELHPFDFLEPESDNDVAAAYRIAYSPNMLSPSQFGLLAAWSEIAVESESDPALADLNHIRQFTVSLFADWKWDKWRLFGNLVYFNNDMQYVGGSVTDEFGSGYVQAEFLASKNWTIFGRIETSFEEDGSLYLNLLPSYIAHRNMIGARWDFWNFQSLTMEFAGSNAQGISISHNRFDEVRVQWSAVFP